MLDFALKLFRLYQSDDQLLRAPFWHQLQRRVELGLERDLMLVNFKRRPSLNTCLAGLCSAWHPRAQQVWMVLALQAHGERCLPEFMRLLADPRSDLAEAAAWGLARFGRAILPDLRERWRYAGPTLRDRICDCLCFLGEQARGAERWLDNHCSDWSRALCYRLGPFGWPPMLRWRETPLWLTDESLAEVAALAFGQVEADRFYALRVLGDWGPAELPARTRLLAALLDDAEAEIAHRALRCLERLQLDPGDEAMYRALTSPHPRLRSWAIGRYIELDHPPLQDEQIVELLGQPGLYPKVLLLVLKRAEPRWRKPLLDAVSAPAAGAELLPWLSDPDLEVRRAALSACRRVGVPAASLGNCLEDSDPQIVREILEWMLRERAFEPLLARLDNRSLRQTLAERYTLLEAIDRVTLDHLRQLGRYRDAASREILKQLRLEAVRWKDWARFNATQQSTALGLLQLHGRLPRELKELLSSGIVDDPVLWQYWAELSRSPREVIAALRRRPHRLGVAPRLGRAGWKLLVGLLNAELSLALSSVALLRSWLSRDPGPVEWVLEAGPRLLQNVRTEAVSHALAAALAETLLTEPEPRKLAWAVELARRTGSAVAALHYFQRDCDNLPPERFLALLLEALQHWQPGVRMLALTILRTGRLDCAEALRRLPPDPDARVRLRTLGLLQSQCELEPEEVSQLRELARRPETSDEANRLLRRLEG